MTYAHSKQIRKFALKTFRNMLIAIGEPNNISLFQEAFPVYVAQINAALNKMDKKNAKLYIQMLAESLRALNESNETQRNFLSDEQIVSLGPIIKRTLDIVTALRQATKKVIENKKRHHEIDEEDIEKVKEDLAKVSKVASEVMELTGQLVEIFKNRAYEIVKANA